MDVTMVLAGLTPLLAFVGGAGLVHAGHRHLAPLLHQRFKEEEAQLDETLRDLFVDGVTGRRLLELRYGLGSIAALLVILFTGNVIFAAAAGALLFFGPGIALRRTGRQRRDRLQAQVLDLINSLIATTKAGMNLHQSLEEAATRMPSPICQELAMVLQRVQAGRTLDASLRACEQRLNLPNLSLVLRSILINEQRGGRLTDLLEKLSASLREIERVEERMKTETAGVRLSSKIMATMPLLVGALLYLAAPEQMSMLFTTLSGNAILLLAAILDFVGFSMIRRLSHLEV